MVKQILEPTALCFSVQVLFQSGGDTGVGGQEQEDTGFTTGHHPPLSA